MRHSFHASNRERNGEAESCQKESQVEESVSLSKEDPETNERRRQRREGHGQRDESIAAKDEKDPSKNPQGDEIEALQGDRGNRVGQSGESRGVGRHIGDDHAEVEDTHGCQRQAFEPDIAEVIDAPDKGDRHDHGRKLSGDLERKVLPHREADEMSADDLEKRVIHGNVASMEP